MSRVKRGTHRIKRRKNILRRAKGYRWGRKSKITLAKTAVTKAGVYAYRDRRCRKRDFRRLWQLQINAAVRGHGLTYSRFMSALRQKNIGLDRKILSDLAVNMPQVFAKIVEIVK